MRQKIPMAALCIACVAVFGCGPLSDEKFLFADREQQGEDFSWPVVIDLEIIRDNEKVAYYDSGGIKARLNLTNISEERIDGSFRVSSGGHVYQDNFSAGPMDDVEKIVAVAASALIEDDDIRVSVDCGRKFGVFRRVNSSFPIKADAPVEVRFHPVSLNSVMVSVNNRLKLNELPVRVEFIPDGKLRGDAVSTRDVPPGASVFFEFNFPYEMEHGREIEAKVSWGEGFGPSRKNYSFIFDRLALRGIRNVDFPVEIDGDISEWKGRNYIYLGDGDDVFPEGERRGRWQGAGDQSAKLYKGWDGENFYIAASVRDDAHFNFREGSSIWDGDALQFAVIPPAGGAEAFNMGLALTQNGASFHKFTGADEISEKAEYAVVRDCENKKTYYELSIPLRMFSLEPGSGTIFGFNAVFFDDDDGEGYDYWLQISPGIAGGWNPSAFDYFVLID